MIGSFQRMKLAAASMGQALELPEWVTRSDPDYVEGERLSELGNLAEAEACFLRADANAKSRSSSRGGSTKVLLALAHAQWKQGKLSEARDAADSARELLEGKRKSVSALANCLDLLGSIQEESGQLEESRRRFREALEIQEKVTPLEPSTLIQRCRRLAKALGSVSENTDELRAESIELLKRGIEIAEKHLGTCSPAAAECLMELGQLQMACGDKETGFASMERAVEIHREIHGPASEELARDYQNLASACHTAGELEKAIKYYERALSIRERQVGGNSSDVGILLMGFADAQSLLGNDGPATELLQEAVGKLSGAGDDRLAWALEYLGVNYARTGRFGDAVGCHRRARTIWEKDSTANQEILEANAFRLDEAMVYAPPETLASHPTARRERPRYEHLANSADTSEVERSEAEMFTQVRTRAALLHPSLAIQRFIQGQSFQVAPALVRSAGPNAQTPTEVGLHALGTPASSTQMPAQIAPQAQPDAQVPLDPESGVPANLEAWPISVSAGMVPIDPIDGVPLLMVGNGGTPAIADPLTVNNLSSPYSENEINLQIAALQSVALQAANLQSAEPVTFGRQPLRSDRPLKLMVVVPGGSVSTDAIAATAGLPSTSTSVATKDSHTHLTGWEELDFDLLPSC